MTQYPLYVTSRFSLVAFKILSLSWNFSILIMMCLAVGLFRFLLLGTLCFLDLCDFSLIKLGKFSIITFSNRFSIPCSSSSPLVSLLYRYYYVSCCPEFPLTLFILSEPLFLFLLILGVFFFFYFVLQLI